MFWVMHSGIIAAMATVFGRYAGFFVPLSDRGIRAVAVSAILGFSALNYIGVKRGSAVQTAFTITKVAAVALIVVVGFAVGSRLPDHFQQGAAVERLAERLPWRWSPACSRSAAGTSSPTPRRRPSSRNGRFPARWRSASSS
jgi:amino acid transporter